MSIPLPPPKSAPSSGEVRFGGEPPAWISWLPVGAVLLAAAFFLGRCSAPPPPPAEEIETILVRTEWATRTFFRKLEAEKKDEHQVVHREVLEWPDGTKKTTEDIATNSSTVRLSLTELDAAGSGTTESATQRKVTSTPLPSWRLGALVGPSPPELFAGRSLLGSMRYGLQLEHRAPLIPGAWVGLWALAGGGTALAGISFAAEF